MMRVYQLVRPGELRLHMEPLPEPSDGEVLARIELALTCGTDLKMLERGHARLKLPSRLGHEWAGRVESLGSGVSDFRPGDRIVATPTAPCGDCAHCIRGEENLCFHLFEAMALGAYGEYVLIPRHIVRRNAFRIPHSVTDAHAAMLEPLACIVHGADLVDLSGDRTVVVLGDGPIALLFAQLAQKRGVGQTVLIGRHALRLDVARQLGADVAVDARATDPEEAVKAVTDGLGGDTVIECVGRPEAWHQAVRLARRGGEVLFFGGCKSGTSVRLDTERVHYDELTLKGAFHYTPDSVRRAWDLVCSHTLMLDPLITNEMTLEELPAAFALLRRREAVKVAIVP